MTPYNEEARPIKGQTGGVTTMDKNSNEYKIKRQKNNDAVKKSRKKNRENTKILVDSVNNLKEENKDLEEKIKTLHKELDFLKNMFIEHAGSHHLTEEQINLLREEHNAEFAVRSLISLSRGPDALLEQPSPI